MSFVALYPMINAAGAARIRMMALDDRSSLSLKTLGGQGIPLDWSSTKLDNGAVVLSGTAALPDLPPDTEVTVMAMDGGTEVQRATVRTLPNDLSNPDSELRLVLASCYCRLRKSSTNASALYSDLFGAHGTPHLKIWCGDQVYLDSPATHFLVHWTQTPAEIARSHLEHYVRTWSKDHLAEPLARGANIFAPDDHEYWNNAPYPNVVVPGLYDRDRRKAWTHTATALLSAFQGVPEYLSAPAAPIVVPPISILVVDTRSARTAEGKRVQFMTPESLTRLREWVASLANIGPGLLVIGQPIFQSAGDKKLIPRVFEDYSLADYEQFAE
jgi:hypothetical protein